MKSCNAQYPQYRPRRARASEALRRLFQETHVAKSQLIMPYFVREGRGVKEPILSMPGQFRFSSDTLLREAESLQKAGVSALLLFGLPEAKDDKASKASSKSGIVQKTVRELKKRFQDLLVITDVCLCAYTHHGHCGLLNAAGAVENDASLPVLARTALSHAEAGADMVAPSDMMDGRVGAIRRMLDENGMKQAGILSYSAKYSSAFYGPFRDAAHSAPISGKKIPKDRKTYQMNPANRAEALREIELDIQEGADMVMVKPALSYLDILREARDRFDFPLAAYLVSGEYAMIKAAAQKGWLDERAAVMETLMACVRAGANTVLTYHAKDISGWISSS